jgi:hypothetical protein
MVSGVRRVKERRSLSCVIISPSLIKGRGIKREGCEITIKGVFTPSDYLD